jgi:hypothetical protein
MELLRKFFRAHKISGERCMSQTLNCVSRTPREVAFDMRDASHSHAFSPGFLVVVARSRRSM